MSERFPPVLNWIDAIVAALVNMAAWLPFEPTREFAFMRHALVALLLLAPACAAAGVFVVNLRMAFYSDAVAHSGFAGVAVGLLVAAVAPLEWPDWVSANLPFYTLIAVGLLVGIIITVVKRRSDLGTDTVIGVAFSAITAIGIMILTYGPRRGEFTRRFNEFLYGDVTLIDLEDLRAVLVLAVVTAAFMLWSYNRLLLVSFNEDLARSRGTASRLYDYAFAILVALLVTAGIRLVGILLITAMLVVPAATARNLARSAGQVFWLAVAASLISGLGGGVLAFYIDAAVGATVVLMGTVLFAVSLVPSRRCR